MRAARRATLANGTAPEFTLLPEADTADMEFFVEQIGLILPILGFDFARPQPSAAVASTSESGLAPVFEMRSVGVDAHAIETETGFLVLKGPTARAKGTQSWESYRPLRDSLLAQGRLVQTENPNVLSFAEDVAFASPSAAAAVVYAGNSMPGTWMAASLGRSRGRGRPTRSIRRAGSSRLRTCNLGLRCADGLHQTRHGFGRGSLLDGRAPHVG